MSAELGLAIIGAVDLCLKYGTRLVELCKSIRTIHEDLEDLVLRIESALSRTSIQLKVFRSIHELVDEEYNRTQERLLRKLSGRLCVAIDRIEPVVASARSNAIGFKHFKYVVLKEDIQKTVDDIEDWQSRYDPTWYLIALISSTTVDREVQKFSRASVNAISVLTEMRGVMNGSKTGDVHVNLDPADFDISTAVAIEYSPVKVFTRSSGTTAKRFLLDNLNEDMYCTTKLMKEDAQALAKRLKVADTDVCGLLKCSGLVKQRDETSKQLRSIHLVFPISEAAPISLRAQLIRSHLPSLSQRLNIAKSLAKSISFVHVCGFVHKNIRPETIITFSKDDGGNMPTFLLGFNGFRNVHFQTLRKGETALEKNLYRHPSRQGALVQDSYTMQHDVYSLGVVLLEIGLWTSFFSYPNGSLPNLSSSLGLDLKTLNVVDWPWETRLAIKDHLLILAGDKLPSSMGDKYTKIVVTCLTCLDDNSDFYQLSEIRDEDGLIMGVKFIEKILLGLSDISL